jgi:hypothetical protein
MRDTSPLGLVLILLMKLPISPNIEVATLRTNTPNKYYFFFDGNSKYYFGVGKLDDAKHGHTFHHTRAEKQTLKIREEKSTL